MKRLKSLKRLPGPVLITGHTGFKGVWLTLICRSLGIETIGYSLPPDSDSLYANCNMYGKNKEVFQDISEYDQLRHFIVENKPCVIFHLAAQALVLDSYEDPRKTFQTNLMGTVNILNLSQEFDFVKAVGVITTDKVYQNQNSNRKFKEDDPLRGSDPYSASKVAAEAAIYSWQHSMSLRQIEKAISLRAGNVIGGGDLSKNRLLPDMVRSHFHGEVLNIRNPNSTRPWQHVIDPLVGYLAAIEKILSGGAPKALNFGPKERSLNVREVINIAKSHWLDLQITIEKQSNTKLENEYLELDSSLAFETLGWQPKITQRSAILSTLKWWDDVMSKEFEPLKRTEVDIATALDDYQLI